MDINFFGTGIRFHKHDWLWVITFILFNISYIIRDVDIPVFLILLFVFTYIKTRQYENMFGKNYINILDIIFMFLPIMVAGGLILFEYNDQDLIRILLNFSCVFTFVTGLVIKNKFNIVPKKKEGE